MASSSSIQFPAIVNAQAETATITFADGSTVDPTELTATVTDSLNAEQSATVTAFVADSSDPLTYTTTIAVDDAGDALTLTVTDGTLTASTNFARKVPTAVCTFADQSVDSSSSLITNSDENTFKVTLADLRTNFNLATDVRVYTVDSGGTNVEFSTESSASGLVFDYPITTSEMDDYQLHLDLGQSASSALDFTFKRIDPTIEVTILAQAAQAARAVGFEVEVQNAPTGFNLASQMPVFTAEGEVITNPVWSVDKFDNGSLASMELTNSLTATLTINGVDYTGTATFNRTAQEYNIDSMVGTDRSLEITLTPSNVVVADAITNWKMTPNNGQAVSAQAVTGDDAKIKFVLTDLNVDQNSIQLSTIDTAVTTNFIESTFDVWTEIDTGKFNPKFKPRFLMGSQDIAANRLGIRPIMGSFKGGAIASSASTGSVLIEGTISDAEDIKDGSAIWFNLTTLATSTDPVHYKLDTFVTGLRVEQADGAVEYMLELA